jgi:MOB kinase activator 1
MIRIPEGGDENLSFRANGDAGYQYERGMGAGEQSMTTIPVGNLRGAVELPEGEDINEWLAKHVNDFHHQLSMLYATIREFCTAEQCPLMTAGAGYKYLWSDGSTEKPVNVSAPDYIRLLLDWVNLQLGDEAIFPSVTGVPFPENFIEIVRNIMKRLFRIYAHCYYHHLESFHALGTSALLNTSFKHFVFFVHQFDLVDPDQLDPLRDMIDEILRSG